MNIIIREMTQADYEAVAFIYLQGIRTKRATFQTEAPSYMEWDENHMMHSRFVAETEENQIVGWVALSPTSKRYAYRGVCEVSIYVHEDYRGLKIGKKLLHKVMVDAKNYGIWTLQSVVCELNAASLALHQSCGFHIVGKRERIAKDVNGVWQNTILLEYRNDLE